MVVKLLGCEILFNSFFVTTSKAPVTTSVAPVTTSKAPVTTEVEFTRSMRQLTGCMHIAGLNSGNVNLVLPIVLLCSLDLKF